MGTSSDLWVKFKDKSWQSHASYDGHLSTAGFMLAATAAHVGLDCLRQAFSLAKITTPVDDDAGQAFSSRLDFQTALSVYQENAISHGRELLVNDPNAEPIYWDFPYTGIVPILNTKAQTDTSWLTEAKTSLYQIDLDQGTFKIYYGDEQEFNLDIKKMEKSTTESIKDFFSVLEDMLGEDEYNPNNPALIASRDKMYATIYEPVKPAPLKIVYDPPVLSPPLAPENGFHRFSRTRGSFEFPEAAAVLRHGIYVLSLAHPTYNLLKGATEFFVNSDPPPRVEYLAYDEGNDIDDFSSKWREAINAFGRPIATMSSSSFPIGGNGILEDKNSGREAVRLSWNGRLFSEPGSPHPFDDTLRPDAELTGLLEKLTSNPAHIDQLKLLQMTMPRPALSSLVDKQTPLPLSEKHWPVVAGIIHDFARFRFAVDPAGLKKWAVSNKDSLWMKQVLENSPFISRRWLEALPKMAEINHKKNKP